MQEAQHQSGWKTSISPTFNEGGQSSSSSSWQCVLPPGQQEHTIDGVPYEVKKAGTTPLPTDITFDALHIW